MENRYKIAFIGRNSSILLYQALGCHSVAVEEKSQAAETALDLFVSLQEDETSPEFAILFVEEDFYESFPEDLIDRFTRKALPAVIPVPSPTSASNPKKSNRLKKIVEKAVGSDILG